KMMSRHVARFCADGYPQVSAHSAKRTLAEFADFYFWRVRLSGARFTLFPLGLKPLLEIFRRISFIGASPPSPSGGYSSSALERLLKDFFLHRLALPLALAPRLGRGSG